MSSLEPLYLLPHIGHAVGKQELSYIAEALAMLIKVQLHIPLDPARSLLEVPPTDILHTAK